jgi:hypothetical protein
LRSGLEQKKRAPLGDDSAADDQAAAAREIGEKR